jgi:hypothetical protein
MENDCAIDFPALYFMRDGVMAVANSPADLEITTPLGLKRRVYDDMRIIDHSGHEFLAQGVTKLGSVGRFGGWDLFLNQNLSVRLHCVLPHRRILLLEEPLMVRACDLRPCDTLPHQERFAAFEPVMALANGGLLRMSEWRRPWSLKSLRPCPIGHGGIALS